MRRIPAALALSALIVLVYLLQLAVPGVSNLAFEAGTVLQEPWTIVTAMFLHDPGDYMHLLNNLFFLALFGVMLERAIGTPRFVALYLAAGIVANLSAFTFYPDATVLGASGAISGIVAALAVLRPRQPGLLWGVPAPMWVVLGGWLFINIAGFGSETGVAYEAHLYGLVFGAAAGLYFRRTLDIRPRRSDPRDEEVDIDVETWEDRYMREDR